MLTGIIQFFYPDIKKEEVKKNGLLALAFLFTIGAYWLLRLLKDVTIYKLAFPEALGWSADAGRLWIPYIKTMSPVFVFAVVLVYSKLVDMFKRHQLFYVIGSFYICIFSIITGMFYIKSTYGDAFLGKWPLAIGGILGYLFTESFGSLVVALFWSFTISSSTSDQAKRAFPFIIATGQFGSIGGSALLLGAGENLWPFYGLIIVFLFGLLLTIKTLISSVPAEQMKSDQPEQKKSKPDFLGGFKLLFTKPYLMGVLVVSTFYEIAAMIVDYQMKSQASIVSAIDSSIFSWMVGGAKTINFAQFLGIFGVCVNTTAFLMALLGTSKMIKNLGVRSMLIIYPITFGLALLALYGYYVHSPSATALLWATFGVMILIKAASYAVNNPVKEIMYIPTSKDAKFKTKGITDTFGARMAKMSGANIGGALNVPGNPLASIQILMLYGTLISLGIVGVWLLFAIYVGNKNHQLVSTGEIVK